MNAREYSVPATRLATLLWKLGWLTCESNNDAKRISAAELEQALVAYQALHGLTTDGWAGPVTERSLRMPRFCGQPDRMAMAETECRWPMKRITWSVTGKLPGLSQGDQNDAYQLAWSYWSDVCDIEPQFSSNSRTANVRMDSGRIDRAGGTLAWSELPCEAQASSQLKQRYDTREPWVISETPGPGQIDLVRVAAHEIGHVIGIPHIESGNLLAPIYDPNVRRPRPGDIAQAIGRYGDPQARPLDPPPTDSLSINLSGRIDAIEIPGFSVSRLEG